MPSDTMLYRAPGPHMLHGVAVDYRIIDADDAEAFDAALADGWHRTPADAAAALRAKQEADAAAATQALADAAAHLDDKPPTREELEQMADKLGLPYKPTTSDKRLHALIDAATKPGEA